MRNVTCYMCNKLGHIASSCPSKNGDKVNNVVHLGGNRSNIFAKIGGLKVRCQIDSGADRCIMREDVYTCIADKYVLDEERTTLQGSGGPIPTMGRVRVPTRLCGTVYDLIFTVVSREYLPCKVLIGDPLLDVAEVKLSREGPVIEPIVGEDYVLLVEEEALNDDGINEAVSRVPEPFQKEVREALEKYKPIAPKETSFKLHVTVKDPKPVASCPRRLSPAEELEIKKQFQEWVDRGVVQPGASEYAAPLVVTWRKDRRVRVCVDYKRLNNVVEKERDPLPLIEDAVDATADSRVHSSRGSHSRGLGFEGWFFPH